MLGFPRKKNFEMPENHLGTFWAVLERARGLDAVDWERKPLAQAGKLVMGKSALPHVVLRMHLDEAHSGSRHELIEMLRLEADIALIDERIENLRNQQEREVKEHH